jgi:hypothetical protein
MPLVCCRDPAIAGLDSHPIQVETGLAMSGLTAWAERNSPVVIENVRSREAIVARLAVLACWRTRRRAIFLVQVCDLALAIGSSRGLS